MKGTQEKFFALMQRLAEENGFEFVADHDWANTGLAAFQRKGSFAPVLRFHFDFQTAYASFDWKDGFDLTAAHYLKDGRDRNLGPRVENTDLDRVVSYITGELGAFIPAENGRTAKGKRR